MVLDMKSLVCIVAFVSCLFTSRTALPQMLNCGFEAELINLQTSGNSLINAGDKDGDGNLDLLVRHDEGITLFENLNGDFLPVADVEVDNCLTFFFEDVDSDGMSDLVAGNPDGFAVYINLGSFIFGPPQQFEISLPFFGKLPATYLEPVDFDGDGDVDIAAAIASSSSFLLFRNNGNGVFEDDEFVSNASLSFVSFSFGDLDADGDQDFVYSHVDSSNSEVGIGVRFNDGNGNFSEPQVIPRPKTSIDESFGVKVVDLNNDGMVEIAHLSFNFSNGNTNCLNVIPNEGGGSFGSPLTYELRRPTSSILVSDLNEDGLKDLVVCANSGVSLLFNSGDAEVFNDEEFYFGLTFRCSSAAAGDWDSDGDIDLATANGPNAADDISIFTKRGYLLGDIDQNGIVELLDIAPFVEILNEGGFQIEADTNFDGAVSLTDVGPFVDLLIGN